MSTILYAARGGAVATPRVFVPPRKYKKTARKKIAPPRTESVRSAKKNRAGKIAGKMRN